MPFRTWAKTVLVIESRVVDEVDEELPSPVSRLAQMGPLT
jgi:hypothetical protein